MTIDSTEAKIGRSMKKRENKSLFPPGAHAPCGGLPLGRSASRTLGAAELAGRDPERPDVGAHAVRGRQNCDDYFAAPRSLVTAVATFGVAPLGGSTAFSRTCALSRTRCKPLNTTISPAARLFVITRMPC